MSNRNNIIDIAKGIGIITVVWGHLPNVCPIKEEIYLFHMPLFFLLSGYFFKDECLSFIEVVKKKLNIYIYPYILFFIICKTASAVLYYGTNHSELFTISPGVIIKPYGVVRPLWFFLSLFEVQIIYFLISKCTEKEFIKSLLSLICLLIGFSLYKMRILLPLYLSTSLSMIIFLHIGQWINQHAILTFSLQKQIVIIIIGSIIYISAVYLNINVDVMLNHLGNYFPISILAAISASCIILYFSKHIEKIRCLAFILKYLGKNSLIIFALHILCFEIGRYIIGFPKLENSTLMEGIYLTIFAIICSLFIGYPIKKYILSLNIFKYTPYYLHSKTKKDKSE